MSRLRALWRGRRVGRLNWIRGWKLEAISSSLPKFQPPARCKSCFTCADLWHVFAVFRPFLGFLGTFLGAHYGFIRPIQRIVEMVVMRLTQMFSTFLTEKSRYFSYDIRYFFFKKYVTNSKFYRTVPRGSTWLGIRDFIREFGFLENPSKIPN